MFRRKNTHTKIGLLAIINSFFLSFVVIVPTKCAIYQQNSEKNRMFPTQSTKISARSQQLVGISRVSGFLVGIMNKTISRVLQTQGHNFTDKR